MVTEREYKKAFALLGMLSLDLGGNYTVWLNCENLSRSTFIICTLLYVCMLYCNKNFI